MSTEAVVALSTAAGTSSIAAVSPLKVVPRSVSSHVAQLEDRLKVKPEADSQLTMAQPPSLSVGLLQASSFSPYGHKSIVQHMSSSKSLAKKSEKVKSPGGASLDILLGIGFYEEEGDDMLNSSSSLKGIRTSQNKSTPELHDVALGANLNKSTDTQSSAAVTVEIPVRAHRGHGRGRNEIEKISTGVNDIFRDDEDSSTGSEMIKATGCKSRVSTDTDTSSRKRVLVPDEVTTNVNSAFNSLSESLNASNPIQPYKRRATLRRAAVSFATEVLSISPKIVVRKFEEDFDSVIESLSNTVLDSGCRRSRRLSGSGSSVFSSGSKIETKIIRRGTPHAANRPRFTRPLSRDSMGSRGSEGSTGGSSDYGSYFSSMEESPQVHESIFN